MRIPYQKERKLTPRRATPELESKAADCTASLAAYAFSNQKTQVKWRVRPHVNSRTKPLTRFLPYNRSRERLCGGRVQTEAFRSFTCSPTHQKRHVSWFESAYALVFATSEGREKVIARASGGAVRAPRGQQVPPGARRAPDTRPFNRRATRYHHREASGSMSRQESEGFDRSSKNEGLNEPSGKRKVQWVEGKARDSMRMAAVAKLTVAV